LPAEADRRTDPQLDIQPTAVDYLPLMEKDLAAASGIPAHAEMRLPSNYNKKLRTRNWYLPSFHFLMNFYLFPFYFHISAYCRSGGHRYI
jgi:hypothetical protein